MELREIQNDIPEQMTMWRLSMLDGLKRTPVSGVLVVTVGNWNDVVTVNPTVFKEIPPKFSSGQAFQSCDRPC
jgi:hypothetical protein